MGTSDNLLPTPRAGNPGSRPNKKGGKILAEVISTSSQEASPASLFPKPEKEKEQMTTAISGQRCLESYEIFSRHGSSLKMCVAYLLSSKAWYSSKCALTWKEKVTKSNRLLFQLSPSTHRTDGTGYGLLRTADANMERGQRTPENLHDRYVVRKMPLNLNDQLAMLPTPAVRDYKGANGAKHFAPGKRSHMGQLPNAVQIPHGNKTGLKLQPIFVEYMMGYPYGWTDISTK